MSNKNIDLKIRELIKYLRDCSKIEDIKDVEITIPDDCEKYGFVQGSHSLSVLLHFLADMLE